MLDLGANCSFRNVLDRCNRMTTEYITEPGDATKIAHDITRKATELAKAMRAAKKGKKSYDEAAAAQV